MAGPVEILIVVGVMVLVGIYLGIASRFIRADEHHGAPAKDDPAEPSHPDAGRRLASALR